MSHPMLKCPGPGPHSGTLKFRKNTPSEAIQYPFACEGCYSVLGKEPGPSVVPPTLYDGEHL